MISHSPEYHLPENLNVTSPERGKCPARNIPADDGSIIQNGLLPISNTSASLEPLHGIENSSAAHTIPPAFNQFREDDEASFKSCELYLSDDKEKDTSGSHDEDQKAKQEIDPFSKEDFIESPAEGKGHISSFLKLTHKKENGFSIIENSGSTENIYDKNHASHFNSGGNYIQSSSQSCSLEERSSEMFISGVSETLQKSCIEVSTVSAPPRISEPLNLSHECIDESEIQKVKEKEELSKVWMFARRRNGTDLCGVCDSSVDENSNLASDKQQTHTTVESNCGSGSDENINLCNTDNSSFQEVSAPQYLSEPLQMSHKCSDASELQNVNVKEESFGVSKLKNCSNKMDFSGFYESSIFENPTLISDKKHTNATVESNPGPKSAEEINVCIAENCFPGGPVPQCLSKSVRMSYECTDASTNQKAREEEEFSGVQMLESSIKGVNLSGICDSIGHGNCTLRSDKQRSHTTVESNLVSKLDKKYVSIADNSFSNRVSVLTSEQQEHNCVPCNSYSEHKEHVCVSEAFLSTSNSQSITVKLVADHKAEVTSVHIPEPVRNIQSIPTSSPCAQIKDSHKNTLVNQEQHASETSNIDQEPSSSLEYTGKPNLQEPWLVTSVDTKPDVLEKLVPRVKTVSTEEAINAIRDVDEKKESHKFYLSPSPNFHESTESEATDTNAITSNQNAAPTPNLPENFPESICEEKRQSVENNNSNIALSNTDARKNARSSSVTAGSARNSVSSADGLQSSHGLFVDNPNEAHGFSDIPYSGPIPLSGPISYSGPIPFSGSLSIRSDSSTTSARSFAFPVLAPEWNSSPVKMRQADPRYFRKKQKWRFLCFCAR
eukprot:TRINITY_DN19649_c0_g1_i2.p1 TRINITY_DN19649_c0_g1~~TRINITY_DN19649_c0_g1_i2.p1  ORF type:complete len:837 (+),score=186.29 TRINITY_DN19649_c0_g1_i2:537-3047(+)